MLPYRQWVVVSVVVIIVFGVMDLVLVSVKYASYAQVSAKGTQQSPFMCVSCQQLHETFSDDQKLAATITSLSRKLRDGVESCCAGDSDQMAVIVELIRRKQMNIPAPVKYNPVNVKSGQVSVHKRLLPFTSSGIQEPFSNVSNSPLHLNGSNSNGMWEHVSNVHVLPSGFLILVSGYYHIYSSLEFSSLDRKPCREHAVKTWKQNVVRSRPNKRLSSGEILSSAHTCCDDCTSDKETSYTAGTFYLQAGDHLYVETSGMELVKFKTESTYFGLTMIGNRHQM